jgi:hypothetical protein
VLNAHGKTFMFDAGLSDRSPTGRKVYGTTSASLESRMGLGLTPGKIISCC